MYAIRSYYGKKISGSGKYDDIDDRDHITYGGAQPAAEKKGHYLCAVQHGASPDGKTDSSA